MIELGDIVDRYRVEAQLGQGGMATVYRVRHVSLHTLHALKVLHATHPTVRDRLLTEGRAQASLRHPNLVGVSDVLEVDGNPALLMEFVGGGALDARLRRGPLPLAEAERIFRGVVAGVACAHAAGVIHRDLKPANVLMAESEAGGAATPKVTDFGLAKVLDSGLDGPSLTRSAIAMGTPSYMAPEQVRDARRADHRADIWSLGVMLYELLTGRRPFEADEGVAVMLAVIAGGHTDAAVHRPELEPRLLAAVRGCLVVDRDRRIHDCAALLAVLDGRATIPAAGGNQPPIAAVGAPGPSEATFDPAALLPTPSPPPPTSRPAAALAPRAAVSATSQRADASGRRSASALALVVDEAGEGQLVELVVTLEPGPGKVWPPEGVARDAAVAAQLAVAAALGQQSAAWSTRWAPRGAAVQLHGTSLGLAIALATRAALLQRPLPAGWAFTGGVDLDGRLAPVQGMPAKLRAAAARGVEQVGVPASPALLPEVGVSITTAPTLDTLSELLLPGSVAAPAPPTRWRAAAIALPVLLAWLGWTAPLDTRLHYPLLVAARGRVAVDDVVILGISSDNPRTLRHRHADTLRTLGRAGATAVLIDLALTEPGPEDADIALAIGEVERDGVEVVLPVRRPGGDLVRAGSPALQMVRGGLVEMRREPFWEQVRAAPARTLDGSGQDVWHAAILTAAGHLGVRDAPRFDGDALVIGPLRNPTWAELVFLPPFGDVPVVPYDKLGDGAAFAGKVAIIGAWGGDQDVHRLPDGPRYGPEIEAGLVQALLRQAALRVARPEWTALSAAIAGLGALLLGRALPAGRRALALLAPAAVIGVVAALSAAGVLLGVVPVALAGLVGAWAARARVISAGPRP